MIQNLKSLSLMQWIAVLAVGSAVGVVSGCARNFIKVDTPGTLIDQGFPAKIPLAEVDSYQEEYNRVATNTLLTWEARQDVAEEKAMFIDGVVGAVINPENLAAFGFNPLGGAGASFITLVTMLTGAGKTRREKEKSYNAGLEKGKELANG